MEKHVLTIFTLVIFRYPADSSRNIIYSPPLRPTSPKRTVLTVVSKYSLTFVTLHQHNGLCSSLNHDSSVLGINEKKEVRIMKINLISGWI